MMRLEYVIVMEGVLMQQVMIVPVVMTAVMSAQAETVSSRSMAIVVTLMTTSCVNAVPVGIRSMSAVPTAAVPAASMPTSSVGKSQRCDQ